MGCALSLLRDIYRAGICGLRSGSVLAGAQRQQGVNIWLDLGPYLGSWGLVFLGIVIRRCLPVIICELGTGFELSVGVGVGVDAFFLYFTLWMWVWGGPWH